MILGVGLENFQGFKGYQHVKFAPITVIFGPNASGKSSIGRALRVIRQSGPTDKRSTPGARINLSGDDIDLNSLENVKFGQSKRNAPDYLRITIDGVVQTTDSHPDIFESYSTQVEFIQGTDLDPAGTRYVIRTSYVFAGLVFKEQLVSLDFYLDQWDMDSHVTCSPTDAWALVEEHLDDKCRQIAIEFDDDEDPEFEESDLSQFSWDELFEDHWHLDVYDNLIQVDSHVSKTAQTWIEKHKLKVIRDALSLARSAYRKEFRGLKHVKPFRDVPVRVEVSNTNVSSVENQIKPNIWLKKLTDGRYEVISTRSKFQSEVNDFEVTENFVKDLYTGAAIGFDEVGTGISQVFPILHELFSKPDSEPFGVPDSETKLLIVEQPELHLHPRMQGDLADAVIDAVKNNPWPTQVILETHSENLLLRLQKRIREGGITKNDVSIIYVEPSDAENPRDRFNLMSNIEMDEAGDVIDPFPISFASLRVEDLL